MESAPQAYILMTLAFASGGSGDGGIGDLNSYDFWVPLSLSVSAATFGVAKFLNSGPTSIVGNHKCLKGFGSLTFILIFLIVAATGVGKGFAIGRQTAHILSLGNCTASRGSNGSRYCQQSSSICWVNYLVILLNFLPQIVHVS